MGFLAEDGESDEQVVLVSQSGTVNRIKVRDISIQSRRARYCLFLPQLGRLSMWQIVSIYMFFLIRISQGSDSHATRSRREDSVRVSNLCS